MSCIASITKKTPLSQSAFGRFLSYLLEAVTLFGAARRVSLSLENGLRPDLRDYAILGIPAASMPTAAR